MIRAAALPLCFPRMTTDPQHRVRVKEHVRERGVSACLLCHCRRWGGLFLERSCLCVVPVGLPCFVVGGPHGRGWNDGGGRHLVCVCIHCTV